THEAISPCVTAPRIVQSASPAGAPTSTLATLRARNARAANRSCGASNELVVRMFSWPKNGVSGKKFDATRADDSTPWLQARGLVNPLKPAGALVAKIA